MASLSEKQKVVAAALFARAMVEQGGMRHLIEEAQREAQAETEAEAGSEDPRNPSAARTTAATSKRLDSGASSRRESLGTSTKSRLRAEARSDRGSDANFWQSHEEELLLVMHVFRFLGADPAEAEAYLQVATMPENKAYHVDGLLKKLQAEEALLPDAAGKANEGVARAVQQVMTSDSATHTEAATDYFRAMRRKWDIAARNWTSMLRKSSAGPTSKALALEYRTQQKGPLATLESSAPAAGPKAEGDSGPMCRSQSAFVGSGYDKANPLSLKETRSMDQVGEVQDSVFRRSQTTASHLRPPESFIPFSESGSYATGPASSQLAAAGASESDGWHSSSGFQSSGPMRPQDQSAMELQPPESFVSDSGGDLGGGDASDMPGFFGGGFMETGEEPAWSPWAEQGGEGSAQGNDDEYEDQLERERQQSEKKQEEDDEASRRMEEEMGSLREERREQREGGEKAQDQGLQSAEPLQSGSATGVQVGKEGAELTGPSLHGLKLDPKEAEEVFEENKAKYAAAIARRTTQDADQLPPDVDTPVSVTPEGGVLPLGLEGSSEQNILQVDPMHQIAPSGVQLREGTKVLLLWELLSSFLAATKQSAAANATTNASEAQTFLFLRKSPSRGPTPAMGKVAVGEWFGRAYDARERTAIRIVAAWLGADWHFVGAVERTVSCVSLESVHKAEETASKAGTMANESQRAKASGWSGWGRAASVAGAAVGTGALLAFTGGLAAPLVFGGAAYLGAAIPIAGTALAGVAALAGTSVGSAAIIGACGVAGAQLGSYKMSRRLGDVEGFRFVPVELGPAKLPSPAPVPSQGTGGPLRFASFGKQQQKAEEDAKPKPARLAACVCVAGFGLEYDELVDVWSAVPPDLETFALVYESAELVKLSKGVYDWFRSDAMQTMISNGGQMLLLRALGAAFMLPMTLISATSYIDSQWSVVVNRSDKAGVLLAEVLIKRVHGPRPVTLLGFSMGARVIFSCLCHLVTHYKPEETRGLVEQVVILGAPVPARDKRWPKIRSMVAGRIVNGYSTSDWILGLVYRTSFLLSGIAGFQPVNYPGIQNVELNSVVDSHAEYGMNMDRILDFIEF